MKFSSDFVTENTIQHNCYTVGGSSRSEATLPSPSNGILPPRTPNTSLPINLNGGKFVQNGGGGRKSRGPTFFWEMSVYTYVLQYYISRYVECVAKWVTIDFLQSACTTHYSNLPNSIGISLHRLLSNAKLYLPLPKVIKSLISKNIPSNFY